MITIEISIYKFSELSDESKRKALDKFEPFVGFIYDDAHETVKHSAKYLESKKVDIIG